MSPKVADPAVRTALLEAGARLLAEHGAEGLTVRRLAREVGTSTMAIYTHFGSIDELHIEIRREGFARLAEHLSGVEVTDEPLGDLANLGGAYYRNAMDNPNLYRVMFMEVRRNEETIGLETFDTLVDAIQRCIDTGQIRSDDAQAVADEFWASVHGVCALQIAGLMTPERARAASYSSGMHLVIGLLDPRLRRAEAGADP